MAHPNLPLVAIAVAETFYTVWCLGLEVLGVIDGRTHTQNTSLCKGRVLISWHTEHQFLLWSYTAIPKPLSHFHFQNSLTNSFQHLQVQDDLVVLDD